MKTGFKLPLDSLFCHSIYFINITPNLCFGFGWATSLFCYGKTGMLFYNRLKIAEQNHLFESNYLARPSV